MTTATRLVWATDLDLHELNAADTARVLAGLAALEPARLLLGGGVSNAAGVVAHLEALANAVDVPVSFVLSPRDYAGGDVAALRTEVAAACDRVPHLDWLAFGHVVSLDPGRALVGHGGFDGHGPLADDARDHLRAPLHQAAARFREVVVLTHVPVHAHLLPPGAQATMGVSEGLGALLVDVAEQWPDTQFVVLCGATDAPVTVDLRPNLRLEASGLRVRPGLVRPLSWWPLPERPPRPQDGEGPAPFRPVEEAATVALGVAGPSGRDNDRIEVLGVLQELADTPVSLGYPLTHNESPDDWQRAFAESVHALADDPRLADVDHGGVTLLRWLRHLCLGPVSPILLEDVGRVRLVGDLVRNIVFPDRINQGQKGTCAVTAVESWLAARHPAEYARVVAGLVRPEGRVLLYNGEPMVRDEQRVTWTEMEGWRSPTSRLFQVAGMEYADPDTDYCNTEDTHYEVNTEGLPVAAGTGLGVSAFDRLLEGLTGEIWRVLTDQDAKVAAALEALGLPTDGRLRIDRDAEPILRRALAADDAVFVTLASSGADAPKAGESMVALPHKVRVMKLDRAGGRVHYEDPYDPAEPWIPDVETVLHDHYGHCSMAWDDFFRLVVEMSFQPIHAVGLPQATE